MNLIKVTAILCLLICFTVTGTFACKRSESNEDSAGTSVDPPKLLFNCSMSFIAENTSMITVAELNNSTNVTCQVIADTSYASNDSENTGNDLLAKLCNNLGESVCPSCKNDSSYSISHENISLTCYEEEIATTQDTITTVIMTTESDFTSTEQGNTVETKQTSSSAWFRPSTTSFKNNDVFNSESNLKTSLIIVGVCVVLIIILAVAAFLFRRSKNQKEGQLKPGSDQVVRAEVNATGDLYTVINKNFRGNSEMVDNVIYATNAEAHSEGVVLYSNAEDIGGQSGSHDLYSVVDKSKKTE